MLELVPHWKNQNRGPQLEFCGEELVVGWEGGYVDHRRREGMAVVVDLGEKQLVVAQIDG